MACPITVTVQDRNHTQTTPCRILTSTHPPEHMQSVRPKLSGCSGSGSSTNSKSAQLDDGRGLPSPPPSSPTDIVPPSGPARVAVRERATVALRRIHPLVRRRIHPLPSTSVHTRLRSSIETPSTLLGLGTRRPSFGPCEVAASVAARAGVCACMGIRSVCAQVSLCFVFTQTVGSWNQNL